MRVRVHLGTCMVVDWHVMLLQLLRERTDQTEGSSEEVVSTVSERDSCQEVLPRTATAETHKPRQCELCPQTPRPRCSGGV